MTACIMDHEHKAHLVRKSFTKSSSSVVTVPISNEKQPFKNYRMQLQIYSFLNKLCVWQSNKIAIYFSKLALPTSCRFLKSQGN